MLIVAIKVLADKEIEVIRKKSKPLIILLVSVFYQLN